MADYQIGNNLYGTDSGLYYDIQKGWYKNPDGSSQYGGVKNYVSSPWGTSQSQINNLYGAQQKQQLDSLKQQQQTALNGLNQQQKVSDQGFYSQRNQADVTNAQNVQRMREVMAQNGLNTSGENITATAGLNAQRQAAFNDINDKQNQANSQFTQQRADINNPQHAQDIINQINAQKSQALMNSYHDYLTRLDAQRQQYLQGQQFDASQSMDKYKTDMAAALQKALGSTPSQSDIEAILQASGFQGNQGGGDSTSGVKGTTAFNANLATANKRGVPAADNAALTWLVSHESGFDPNAQNRNSTAYGYGQFLTATRRQYEKETGLSYNDPVNQLIMMEQYVKDRYGSAANAVNFWKKHGWY